MPLWNKNVTWEEARSQTLTSFIDVPLLLRVVIFARKKCIRKNQNCKYFFSNRVSKKLLSHVVVVVVAPTVVVGKVTDNKRWMCRR